MLSPEAIEKRQATKRANVASGKTVYPRGEQNKQWMGGPKACVKRRREDGREAAGLRAWRRENPDKVREFKQRRSSKKDGAKLPRGTVTAIRKAQGNKCAICRTSLKPGSHLDHVVPLARGGKHEGRNLQLLCPPCNLAKSDRDPVEHMRSLGRLI
jgi:5-methylcytosine-specific restriction endonuclease McrA